MSDEPRDFHDISDNPYAAPTTSSQPVDVGVDVAAEPLGVFVGPRANYYLRNWALKLQGRGQVQGFNVGAFFLGGLWLAYRKMYKWSIFFFVIILIESIAEDILFLIVLEMPETPPPIALAINLGIAVAFGVLGNRWYLIHAQREVSAAQEQGLEGMALRQHLSRRGGTNFLAGFGLLILYLLVFVAAFSLLEMIFFPEQWEMLFEE